MTFVLPTSQPFCGLKGLQLVALKYSVCAMNQNFLISTSFSSLLFSIHLTSPFFPGLRWLLTSYLLMSRAWTRRRSESNYFVILGNTRFTLPACRKLTYQLLLIPNTLMLATFLCIRLMALPNNEGSWLPFTCKKQIVDPNGRYLLLKGLLQDTEVTILTYYAPNVNPGPFLTHVCSPLVAHRAGTLLLAGDSNLVLNPKLDKYPADTAAPSAVAKRFQQDLGDHDLVDLWRDQHSLAKDFTHYSHPHQSQSRIDQVFMQTPSPSTLGGHFNCAMVRS